MPENPDPNRRPARTFDDDNVFDILRGIEALTGSAIVGDLAMAIATTPRHDLATAFNHKQVGSKRWLVDCVAETLGRQLGRVLVVGGWHGLLSALLLDDPRLVASHVTSLDRDPDCVASASTVNSRHARAGRFEAVAADMYAFDYGDADHPRFDVVINTSCEHIPDLRAWLHRLPAKTSVVLQSNDYGREPDHVTCVDSLSDFETVAALAAVAFRGERPTKNYRRFMLIGKT